MIHKEYNLQKQVCSYLKSQYKDVVFISTGINLKLTPGQAVRNKSIQKDNFSCPDLLILEPNRYFKGLFIELKKESPFKKDGVTLLKSDHLEAQQLAINNLLSKGYFAAFKWEFEDIKELINWYMKNR